MWHFSCKQNDIYNMPLHFQFLTSQITKNRKSHFLAIQTRFTKIWPSGFWTDLYRLWTFSYSLKWRIAWFSRISSIRIIWQNLKNGKSVFRQYLVNQSTDSIRVSCKRCALKFSIFHLCIVFRDSAPEKRYSRFQFLAPSKGKFIKWAF